MIRLRYLSVDAPVPAGRALRRLAHIFGWHVHACRGHEECALGYEARNWPL